MALVAQAARHRAPAEVPPVSAHAEDRAPWRLAALAYLLVGFALWSHAWIGGPASTLPPGSVDPEQSVWFLGWVAHGGDPFFSRAMYFPHGLNLLDNTSTVALGVLLAPISSLFGAIVSFNVAVVLAPATSALAAYFAARRYVAWRPAAFVAGLLYGFGPFLATDLQLGHLNLTFSPVPALVVLCLDELLVTQRRDPRWTGAWLGVLVVVEFFVSTEMLAIMGVTGVLGLALLAVAHRGELGRRMRVAAPGIALGFAISVVALAYPAWFALLGPEHVSGPVFGSTAGATASLWSAIVPHAARPGVLFISKGNGAYLGPPLVVVLGLGVLRWRRARGLVYFCAMAGISFLLSLGGSLHITNTDTGVPLPAALLAHLPVLWSIMPSRFGLFVDLFAALALGIVLDRLRAEGPAVLARARPGSHPPVAPALLPLGVAAVVVASLAAALPWPYRVARVPTPAIVHIPELEALAPGSVLSAFPSAPQRQGPLLVAQAQAGYRFSSTGGYAIVPGPSGRNTEEPESNPLQLLYTAAALGRLPPAVGFSEARGVLDAIAGLHVTAVIVDRAARGGPGLAAVLARILGPPSVRAGSETAWVLGRPR